MQEFLEKGIIARFTGPQEIATKFFEFANNLLNTTKSGIFAFIGSGLLFISITRLFYNVETFFQNLYGKKRKLKDKVGIYFILVLTVPIFLILSGIFKLAALQKIYFIPSAFFSYILTIFLFTFVYFLVPKEKIRFSFALISGILGGVSYEVLQWGYVYFQVNTTRLSLIYGSFAALPFLLIWIKISWMIFLFCANLCYSMKKIREEF